MSEVVGTLRVGRLAQHSFVVRNPLMGFGPPRTYRWSMPASCLQDLALEITVFVVDFRTQSIVGASPPKVVRVAARRLNTTIPHVAEKCMAKLEQLMEEHHLNSRLIIVASL